MKARWSVTCAKCDCTIQPGDTIKPQYRKAGMNPETGRPVWVRVPRAYVHAPRCPKVTPNRPGRIPRNVDPLTGEIIEADLAPIQLTLGSEP